MERTLGLLHVKTTKSRLAKKQLKFDTHIIPAREAVGENTIHLWRSWRTLFRDVIFTLYFAASQTLDSVPPSFHIFRWCFYPFSQLTQFLIRYVDDTGVQVAMTAPISFLSSGIVEWKQVCEVVWKVSAPEELWVKNSHHLITLQGEKRQIVEKIRCVIQKSQVFRVKTYFCIVSYGME